MLESRNSQQKRLLKLLKDNEGKWVSMKDIVFGLWIFQYNARIHQLRKKLLSQGYNIENKVVQKKNWFSGEVRKYGYFRLVKIDPRETLIVTETCEGKEKTFIATPLYNNK